MTAPENLWVSQDYHYASATPGHHHDYLMPTVLRALEKTGLTSEARYLFELGCGNGSVANILQQNGWDITGVDPSEEGIQHANSAYPSLKLSVGSAYDDLAGQYGQFPVLLSLEVIEHVYAPRQYAKTVFNLLEPGGVAIISSPYHGYWKNLALAVTGKMDAHFTALWDHGHIKFWSVRTLGELLREVGFVDLHFERVGRIPMLAKSMVAIAKKPKVS
jgi:2-polyprenyl-3-methyl-5-hydroxy-6-metoxy-1,4-benzoquinol methylase